MNGCGINRVDLSSAYIFNTVEESAHQIINNEAQFRFYNLNPGFMTTEGTVVGVVREEMTPKLVRFSRKKNKFTILEELEPGEDSDSDSY